VVISVGTWLRQPYQNKKYFDLFNRTIIAGLERISTNFEQVKLSEKFGQRGLSDITYGDKKVGGTSLFRSRNYSLYQASLLVDSQLPLINKYLCHPSREPDYRRGRSHAEFLGSLSEVIAGSKAEEVAAKLSIFLPEILGELGKEEIIEPQEVQFGHLLQRAAGAFS
jgi:lipoate-protein ligase A